MDYSDDEYSTVFKEKLIVVFDDIENNIMPGKLMSSRNALDIISFVERCIENGIEEILIHCDAGLGRSPAVTRALQEIFELQSNLPDDYDLFNQHVYGKLNGVK